MKHHAVSDDFFLQRQTARVWVYKYKPNSNTSSPSSASNSLKELSRSDFIQPWLLVLLHWKRPYPSPRTKSSSLWSHWSKARRRRIRRRRIRRRRSHAASAIAISSIMTRCLISWSTTSSSLTIIERSGLWSRPSSASSRFTTRPLTFGRKYSQYIFLMIKIESWV